MNAFPALGHSISPGYPAKLLTPAPFGKLFYYKLIF